MKKSWLFKKSLVSALIPLIFIFTGVAYAETWAKVVNDDIRSIQPTSDGGSITAGTNLSKLDGSGSVQWAKNYGSNLYYSVQQTSDGGYVAAGVTGGPFGLSDFLVLKLDSEGNIQWQMVYGSYYGEWPNSIRQTSDDGYIVVGYHWYGVVVMKLDPNGNIQWQKAYGGGHDFDYLAYSIYQTPDGGYIWEDGHTYSSLTQMEIFQAVHPG
ncbi:MAG: hypothetical protein HY754_11305 [Nitrospirae bacterium]|nr:hypothetical protein [Nitrospirota bacterium]